MKRLLLLPIFLLALSGAAYGQTPVTVTGTVYAPNGALATSGYVQFTITPTSQSIQYFVLNIAVIAPQTARCRISAIGLVKNLALTGACQVWGNDVISPGNTLYTVAYAPGNVVSNTVQRQLITGTTYSLNAPVFGPVVQVVPQFQTITTAPIASNLLPATTDVFNVGQAGREWAAGYFKDLFATNATIVNYIVTNWLTRNLNGILFVNGNNYATLAAALAACPAAGCVIVDTFPEVWSVNPLAGFTGSALVLFGEGNWTVGAKVILPDRVQFNGAVTGRPTSGGTIFTAGAGLINTSIVQLGDGTNQVFYTRLDNVRLDCNHNVGCKGLSTIGINEGSGSLRLDSVNFRGAGGCISIDESLISDNWKFEQVNCGTSNLAGSVNDVVISNGGSVHNGVISKLTCVPDGGAVLQNSCVYLTGALPVSTVVHMSDIHAENHTNVVFFDTNSGGLVDGSSGTNTVTNTVRLNTNDAVSLHGVDGVSATNVITNTLLGQVVIGGQVIADYNQAASTNGRQVFMSGGTNGNQGALESDSIPRYLVRSTASAAGASRSAYDLMDGNNNGWRTQFDADSGGGNLYYGWFPYAAGVLGSEVAKVNVVGDWSARKYTSTVATGTAPLVIASTTTVPNLTASNHPTVYDCGTTTTCGNTQKVSTRIIIGTAPLDNASPSKFTITGISPAFTGTATYTCWTYNTAQHLNDVPQFSPVSSSSFTFTTQQNTLTDVMAYGCAGY
jgi:hypothetical protein